jgi:DNA polymerase-3 subunit gamma/tau
MQRFDFKRILPMWMRNGSGDCSDGADCNWILTPRSSIARLADGGMRDAISLLDLCSSHDEVITLQTVVSAAGINGK